MRRATTGAGLVAVIAAGLVIAACASAKNSGRAPAPVTAEAPPMGPSDREKAEIVEMMRQIEDMRRELGLQREPPHQFLIQYRHMSVAKLRLCDNPQPNGKKCKDTCRIKDQICDNAENICRIAGDLAGDDWAKDKCDRAKASCKEAAKKCCECATAEAEQNASGNLCGA